jgi:DNA mismatch endonuclease, patch repair protein
MDNLTPEQRRKNMQNIRSVGTIPERLVMRELKRRGVYFASNVRTLPGKPDIVFRRKKIAVFIDSDFWHGHKTRFIMPQDNVTYWRQKIERNKNRDKEVSKALRKKGWKILRIWEYDVKKKFNKSIDKILKALEENSENL